MRAERDESRRAPRDCRGPDSPFASELRLDYAELHCLSNYSLLRGASHPDELVARAAELGYRALAITDRNTLAGVVRAHVAVRAHHAAQPLRPLRLIIGAEVHLCDAPPVVLLATDRPAYGRLARLLTVGNLRADRNRCALDLRDLARFSDGLIAIALPPRDLPAAGLLALPDDEHPWVVRLRRLRAIFGDRLYLAAELGYELPETLWLGWLQAVSRFTGVPLVACGGVYYHVPQRRYLQDILTCIRERVAVCEAGSRLFRNAQRSMRPLDEIAYRYRGFEAALARTMEIAGRCRFTLDELRYFYPREVVPEGRAAWQHLRDLTYQGARQRGVGPEVYRLIERELKLIAELKYEHYFLTVHDLVRFARSRGILCQGRGSAANSAVCYCLGITAVDPARHDLLFERFISAERNEPPDIDVDFEHERREEVIQYIYRKYGRERAAITAEVITYRPRSAIRDVGRALGLGLDRIDVLARAVDWYDPEPLPRAALARAGLEPGQRTTRQLVYLVRELLGFPRHLSQHVGGFVITDTPLCEVVPLRNAAMPARTQIEWDKDDIDALGILKVDVLGLGILTVLSKCARLGAWGGPRSGAAGHGAWREQGTGNREQATHWRLIRYAERGWMVERAHGERLQRADCLAQSDGAGQGGVPDHRGDAGGGALWVDAADSPGGGIRREQYCRGQRASDPHGLRPLSDDRKGIIGGAGYADAPGRRVGDVDAQPAGKRVGRRGGPVVAGPHLAAEKGRLKAGGRRPIARSRHRRPELFPVPCSLFPQPMQGLAAADLARIPDDDPAVYDMICRADTIGVFQIESRAQMSMLSRLKPRSFYDLVIEVAIVRPGPIQGRMVHPYLRRRAGLEKVEYPSEDVRKVLEKTLGVPIFQEQVMKLAVVAAGFTPGEADQLRRSMGAWRRTGSLEKFRTRLLRGMLERGYSRAFAEQIYQQIRGFGEYGFPESHAASFALLVWASAWLKYHYPAHYLTAMLNSQPLGFYSPAQLVQDAIRHGVEVRCVDVNFSEWDCSLEKSDEATERRSDEGTGSPAQAGGGQGPSRQQGEGFRSSGFALRSSGKASGAPSGASRPAVRLGLRMVRGLSRDQIEPLLRGPQSGRTCAEDHRNGRGWRTIEQLHRAGVPAGALLRLAAADAFQSLGLDRRTALWQILALERSRAQESPETHNPTMTERGPARQLALFDERHDAEPAVELPSASAERNVVEDYAAVGFSLRAHPMELIRAELLRGWRGPALVPAEKLAHLRAGQRVAVAGLVTCRQRPGTAKGVVFMTIEDETGLANLIIRPDVWQRWRPVARHAAVLIIAGRIERQGEVVHVMARRFYDLGQWLGALRHRSRDFH